MDDDGPPLLLRPVPAVPPGSAFPSTLWLLRHGESEGNVADQAASRAGAQRLDLQLRDADVPLTALGHEQAAAVGRWLGDQPEDVRPTRVLTSPYRRAVQTLQGVIDASALDVPVHGDERLRERDLGIFDGLTWIGIRDLHPEEAERRRHLGKMWYRPPGGESWADVALRVRSLVAATLPQHAGERVLLVTHQAVIMAFRLVLEGLDGDAALRIDHEHPQPNCALTRYAMGRDGLALVHYADTAAVDVSAAPVTKEPDADVPA
jgi:2,3-bisphosphoglycerate-dependent phosphoglycerate mutase